MGTPVLSRSWLSAFTVAVLFAAPAAATDWTVGGAWGALDQSATPVEEPQTDDTSSDSSVIPLALTDSSSILSDSTLTIGYTLTAFGSFTLDVDSADPVLLEQSGVPLTRDEPIDVYGAYSTSLLGGEVGVFGGYTDSRSAFTLEPTISRTVGASVGYAGFYLRGAYEDAGPDGLLEGRRAWQAGLGYGSDDFDVRVTYVQSAFLQGGPTELEGKQWMIGGLVQLTPSILLNANAFYIDRELTMPTVEPPGAGARVGLQLRF